MEPQTDSGPESVNAAVTPLTIAQRHETQRVKDGHADEAQKPIAAARMPEASDFEALANEMLRRAEEAEFQALRAQIAADHGLSKEDREILLTGTDEYTLRLQAQRLAETGRRHLTGGNVARTEGRPVNHGANSNHDNRDFLRLMVGEPN